jgi:hypothetical protein
MTRKANQGQVPYQRYMLRYMSASFGLCHLFFLRGRAGIFCNVPGGPPHAFHVGTARSGRKWAATLWGQRRPQYCRGSELNVGDGTAPCQSTK